MAGKIIDITGKTYGRLTAISVSHVIPRKGAYWHCKCSCGKSTIVRSNALRSGTTKSCGCTRKGKSRNKKHGESNTNRSKEYGAWQGMKNRCHNKNHEHFIHYGGRGIIVCYEWLDSYDTFLLDLGRAPSKKHSLDRIDVNGNYCKANCKWSTHSEQMKNRRPYTRKSVK